MVEIHGMLLRRRPFRMLYIVVGFGEWGLRYGCIIIRFVVRKILWGVGRSWEEAGFCGIWGAEYDG